MSYLISLRYADGADGVAPPRFLIMDDSTGEVTPAASSEIWANDIISSFPIERNPANNRAMRRGEILFLVHGFNVSAEAALAFHGKCRDHLKAAGWDGVLISYDWPSDGLTFAYLPDRAHARASASVLVREGIALLEARQQGDCAINVHVMAHSMGAFVTQQAFAWSYQDVPPGWKVGQVLLVAGDVDYTVFAQGNPTATAFAQHAGRLTTYSNHYDKALLVSNVKRVGMAPRVGRVGLPDDSPSSMVGVDCSALFEKVDPGVVDDLSPITTHSFYFDQEEFWNDAVLTLAGGIDRGVFPTRVPAQSSSLADRFDLRTDDLGHETYQKFLNRAKSP